MKETISETIEGLISELKDREKLLIEAAEQTHQMAEQMVNLDEEMFHAYMDDVASISSEAECSLNE